MGIKGFFRKGIKEKDNVGTRISSSNEADRYWFAHLNEIPHLRAKNSYFYYVFPSYDSARHALLELSFMQETKDTNSLICTEPYYYGLYKNEKDQWEAMIMGKDISEELQGEILNSFEQNNGENRIR